MNLSEIIKFNINKKITNCIFYTDKLVFVIQCNLQVKNLKIFLHVIFLHYVKHFFFQMLSINNS